MAGTTNVATNVRVPLNDDVLNKYEAQAKAQNKTLEQVLVQTLVRFQDVVSTKPIILSDAARQHLDKLLGRNLSTGDELVSAVQRGLTVRLDELSIPITPYLLDRLRSRCIGMEFDAFMKLILVRMLEEYVGVR